MKPEFFHILLRNPPPAVQRGPLLIVSCVSFWTLFHTLTFTQRYVGVFAVSFVFHRHLARGIVFIISCIFSVPSWNHFYLISIALACHFLYWYNQEACFRLVCVCMLYPSLGITGFNRWLIWCFCYGYCRYSDYLPSLIWFSRPPLRVCVRVCVCVCVCVCIFYSFYSARMALLLSEDSYYFSTGENLVHYFFTLFSQSFSFFFFPGISSQHVLDFLDQSSISFVFLTHFLSLTRNIV